MVARSSRSISAYRWAIAAVIVLAVALAVGSRGLSTQPASAAGDGGRTFYVSPRGSDAQSGTSPATAWRTVTRASREQLMPGDRVLFEGGATFSTGQLIAQSAGAAGRPIVYGSYGSGRAVLLRGIFLNGSDHVVLQDLSVLSGKQGIDGIADDVTIRHCMISARTVGIQGQGTGWRILGNTVSRTGDSGMLLLGDAYTVAGNTISYTGLDPHIRYGKHGVYLKAPDSTVAFNSIDHFRDDGISVRFHNSSVKRNRISSGPIGIGWFEMDHLGAMTRFLDNTILDTTAAGIFVSGSSHSNRESFRIYGNLIRPAAGVALNLHRTSGDYKLGDNVTRGRQPRA